jgi:starvation-inducible DNA-binding protein
MNGQDFRDYHLLLDGQAEQIFGATDDVGERAHKIGGTTPCSISEISEQQRLKSKNEEPVAPNVDE